jgi:hypothetical protein
MKKVRTLSYPALKEQTYDAKAIHMFCIKITWGSWLSISKGLVVA